MTKSLFFGWLLPSAEALLDPTPIYAALKRRSSTVAPAAAVSRQFTCNFKGDGQECPSHKGNTNVSRAALGCTLRLRSGQAPEAAVPTWFVLDSISTQRL
jgi:hypothetical protein